MIYGAIILSLLITILIYVLDSKDFVWWEFFMPTIATTVVVLCFTLIVNLFSSKYAETWGSTITSVYEQEPYNYWKSETCSREVPCGTDSKGNTEYCTEYYDCSHQEDVGPSWSAKTNLGENVNITEQQYDSLLIQFGGVRLCEETTENYDARDRATQSNGTKFENTRVGDVSHLWKVNWNEKDDTRKAVSSRHYYVNKIKSSDLTVFNIKVVNKKDAKKMGLFEYPKINDNLNYPTILGGNVSKSTQEKFKRLNGKFGPTNEVRLWVLIFDNKPETYGNYQENYWVRGNMNEFVICLSKKDTTLQWCNVFSWSTNEALKIEVRNYIYSLKSVNEKSLDKLYIYLDENLNTYKRRNFSEFDYLKRKNKTWEIILCYVFGIVSSLFMNYWVVTNEYRD